MMRNTSFVVAAVLFLGALTAGCSGSDEGGSSTGDSTSSGVGGAPVDPAWSGGPPAVPGCCAGCYCRGAGPTQASVAAQGPYAVENYTSGFRDGPSFGAATIYYPAGDAAPPFAGVVVCPGYTATQPTIAQWGPFLASHGIVTMTIDTNAPLDSVVQRAAALDDALQALKEENTRPDSPLSGKLSPDRYGLMGWSMGGGATWIGAAKHPELRSAISLAGHDLTAGGPGIATGTTVPSFMFCGATDTNILGGGKQSQGVYDVIPATTPKILYEMAAEGHFSWGTPATTNGGALGQYGLAFQKVFLEGDERYRQFLLAQGPGASEWRSTVE